ncbi:MAG: DUF4340 domain-containing protein [Oligoflexia bacterium]|nr:DUF4340 domain-containing protein [Oligoflexia bacterium]
MNKFDLEKLLAKTIDQDNYLKLGAVALISLIIAFILYQVDQYRPNRDLVGHSLLPGLDLNRLERIEISGIDPRYPNQNKQMDKVVISKMQNQFILESQYSYPVSVQRLASTIFRISEMSIDQKVEIKTKDAATLEKYKLNNNSAKYIVSFFAAKSTTGKDNLIARVYFGDKYRNASSSGQYVTMEGHNEIYIVKDEVDIPWNNYYYLERKIFEIPTQNISAIYFTQKNSREELIKNNEWTWKNSKLLKVADQSKIQTLLNFFPSFEMESVVPEGDLRVQNLNYQHTINITTNNKETYQLLLSLKEKENYLKVKYIATDTNNNKKTNNLYERFVYKLTDYYAQKIKDVMMALGG